MYRERFLIASTAGTGPFAEYLSAFQEACKLRLPDLMLHNKLRNAMVRKQQDESK